MSPERLAAFAVERTRLPDGSIRVAVAGAVDAQSSCDLLDGLVAAIIPGGRLVVDLSTATKVDRTGMAAVALARHLAELHDGTLELVSCPGDARSGWRRSGPPRSILPDGDPSLRFAAGSAGELEAEVAGRGVPRRCFGLGRFAASRLP